MDRPLEMIQSNPPFPSLVSTPSYLLVLERISVYVISFPLYGKLFLKMIAQLVKDTLDLLTCRFIKANFHTYVL
jgi:hypothetical protein